MITEAMAGPRNHHTTHPDSDALLDLEARLRSAPPLLEDVVCGSRLSGAELTAAVDRARLEFDRRIRQHLVFARTALQGRRPS